MVKCLFINNDADWRKRFADLLFSWGIARRIEMEIITHDSLEIEIPKDVDVVITGLNMGFGIDETLRWLSQHAKEIPVVVLTSIEGYEERCLRLGAEDYWHREDLNRAPQIFVDAVNKARIRFSVRKR